MKALARTHFAGMGQHSKRSSRFYEKYGCRAVPRRVPDSRDKPSTIYLHMES